MAQPEIDGVGVGKATFLFGSNGAKWIAALIDALGHLQVDIVASVLSTVLASIDGKDFATQTTLAALAGEDFATQTSLAAILARIVEAPPVPTNPIYDVAVNRIVANNTWVEIASYTVTAGKTFYLTDFYFAPGDPSAGIEFHYSVVANTQDRLHGKCPPGHSVAKSLVTPVKVESTHTIITRVYQWSGGSKSFHGSLIGFEV